jgi:FkbM family methyltransferase
MIKKIINSLNYRLLKRFYNVKTFLRNLYRIKKLDYKKPLFLNCDNLRENLTRAQSCTKEPETIKWLERYKNKKKIVLWDIGANVGAYSLVGASLGFEVFAFEPAFQNYFKLHENISLNKMDKKINAFCIAFGKKTLIGDFNVFDFSYGTSRGNYNSENYFELKLDLVAQKKTLAFEIDKFIEFFNLKEPDLIKIDVDGGEFEILLGAVRLLKNSRRLKSILVEFDQNHNSFLNLKKFLKKHRWVVIEKYYRQPGVYNLILKKI